MGKNLTIKSRVIIVVSVIIAIITVAAIISSYNIFYNNIFATTKQTQFRIATFLADIVYEEMKENFDEVYSLLVVNQFAKSKLTVAQQSHITETALENYNEIDYTFANDELNELKNKVFKYLEGIENEKTN